MLSTCLGKSTNPLATFSRAYGSSSRTISRLIHPTPRAYAHFGAILNASTADAPKARRHSSEHSSWTRIWLPHISNSGLWSRLRETGTKLFERYRRAAELDGQNAAVHYRLAAVYKRLGRRKKLRQS